MVPQERIELPHPAYKTGPLPLRIQGQRLTIYPIARQSRGKMELVTGLEPA